MSINVDTLQDLLRHEDWTSAFSMLDQARRTAVTSDDCKREIFWRSVVLARQNHTEQAVELLRKNAHLFNSQSHVKHEIARLLVSQGRHQEALKELNSAPIDCELDQFYALAIDAKFFYYYLLAKAGDPTIRDRLCEIPDDYRYICHDGTILAKPDIIVLQNGAASAAPSPS